MKIDISCRLGIRPDFQPTFSRGARLAARIVSLGFAGGLFLAGCVAEPPQQRAKKLGDLDRSLFQAAESFEKRRDYATAASYYRNLYNRDASDIEAVVGLSRGLRHLQQAREAQAIILRALKEAPKDYDLRAELGKVQLSLGEPLKAIDQLSRVDAEVEGKRWDIKVALAIGHDRLGMYEQAERRYRQALQLSPENAAVMNNFALSLAQAGRLGEALEILERAAALPEATPRMRQNLALLYAMKGDLASAEQYVRRDMPPEVADQNMTYYRQLRAGMSGGAAPTAAPAVSSAAPQAASTVRLAAKPSSEKRAPPEIIASEDGPATAVATQADKAMARDAGETAPAEPQAKAEATVAPTKKLAPTPGGEAADAKTASESATESVAVTAPEADEKTPEKAAMKPAPVPTEAVKTAEPADNGKPMQAAEVQAVTPQSAAKEPEKTATDNTATNGAAKTSPPGAESSTATSEAVPAGKPDAISPGAQLASVAPGGYRLQLGSFKSLDGAEAMRLKLLKKHGDLLRSVDLVVETVTVPERGDFFRVNSRPVPDREMVDETCLKLAIRDVPCLLIRSP